MVALMDYLKWNFVKHSYGCFFNPRGRSLEKLFLKEFPWLKGEPTADIPPNGAIFFKSHTYKTTFAVWKLAPICNDFACKF